MTLRQAIIWACMAFATAIGSLAHAADTKMMRIIVGGSPGGIDSAIRAMAPTLREKLGQTVVIENKPGANGLLAANEVARSEPDGNTLLYTTSSTIVLAPIFQKSAVEATNALTTVTNIYDSVQVLAVSSRVAAKSLPELIAYAKANPGKLNYASSGNGSVFHVVGELFKQQTGVDLVHVPFKALSPAVQDLVGGHVDLGFLSYNAIQPHLTAGQLRVLAVMAPRRLPDLPDVPAINETLPNFPQVPSWIGIAAPAGTPPARIEQLHRALVEALAVQDVQALIRREGNIPSGKSRNDLTAAIERDKELVAGIVKSAGITPE